MTMRGAGSLVIVLALCGGAGAQTPPAAQSAPPPAGAPAAQPPAGTPAAQPRAGEGADAAPAGFTYDAEGRRDPFTSLLGRATEARPTGTRPAGVPGLLIAEVTVKGVMRDRAGFVAMIQSPDGKAYIVRAGDRLFDGTVKSILPDKVVFSQDVNDPLSLVKQREIPKPVRPAEPGGGNGATR